MKTPHLMTWSEWQTYQRNRRRWLAISALAMTAILCMLLADAFDIGFDRGVARGEATCNAPHNGKE